MRKKSKVPIKRMHLLLPAEDDDEINVLSKKLHYNKSTILRFGIRLFILLHEANKNGGKLHRINSDGTIGPEISLL